MQVQFTAKAYLPTYARMEDVVNGSEMPLIGHGNDNSYFMRQGYALIGTAKVTIELHTEDKILADKLDALLQTVRAENQQRENAILEQISKLTAISYDEPF